VYATDGRGIIEVRRLPADMEARIASSRRKLQELAARLAAEHEHAAVEAEEGGLTKSSPPPDFDDGEGGGEHDDPSRLGGARAYTGAFSAAARLERAGEKLLQSVAATAWRAKRSRGRPSPPRFSRSADGSGDDGENDSSSDSEAEITDGGGDEGADGGTNAPASRHAKGINLGRAVARLSTHYLGASDGAGVTANAANDDRHLHLWPIPQVEAVAAYLLTLDVDAARDAAPTLPRAQRLAAMRAELSEVDADAAASEREMAMLASRLDGMEAEVDGFAEVGAAEAVAVLSARTTASSDTARSAKSPRPTPTASSAGGDEDTSLGTMRRHAFAASFTYAEGKAGAKRALREAAASLREQRAHLRGRLMWLQARAAELFAAIAADS